MQQLNQLMWTVDKACIHLKDQEPIPSIGTLCFRQQNLLILCSFYLGGASNARVIAFNCVSVCVSHAGIVLKRLNVGLRKQRYVIAQGPVSYTHLTLPTILRV